MANPRKFSEKIALQKQKQAEGTAEFEKIMKEVYATKMDETQANQKILECCLVNADTGSNHASPAAGGVGGGGNSAGTGGGGGTGAGASGGGGGGGGSGGASPEGTSGSGGSVGSGGVANRESRGRSVGVGPMRRPSERKQDRSPYGSSSGGAAAAGVSMGNNGQNIAYLSPPMDSSWRRSNSDSALHQTLNMAVAAEGGFGPGGMGGGISGVPGDMNSLHANYHHHNQRSHSPNIGRSYSPQAQRRKGQMLHHQQQQQHHHNQQQPLHMHLQQQHQQLQQHYQQQQQMQQQQQQQQHHQQQQQQSNQQPHPQQQHFNAKFPNCNMPVNSLFKSLQDQAMSFANTGSLPDLTSVHYAAPTQQQLMHQQQQQQQQTLSPILSPHNNGRDRDQSPSPFSPAGGGGGGSGGGGGPPSPYHQQQHSPTSAANTPTAAQTSPNLSFTNLAVQSSNAAQNSAQSGSFANLPTLGAASSTGNLTDYRQPLNPPSPGSSPGLLTSVSGNELHTSAPASPIRHPQPANSLQQVLQGYNDKNMQTFDRYSPAMVVGNLDSGNYNSLNPSFHNHFEQFSLGDSNSSPEQQQQLQQHFQQQQNSFAALDFEDFSGGGNSQQQQPSYSQNLVQSKLIDFSDLTGVTSTTGSRGANGGGGNTNSNSTNTATACNNNNLHQQHQQQSGRTMAQQQQLLNNNSSNGGGNNSNSTNSNGPCRVTNNNVSMAQQNDVNAALRQDVLGNSPIPSPLGCMPSPSSPLPIPMSSQSPHHHHQMSLSLHSHSAQHSPHHSPLHSPHHASPISVSSPGISTLGGGVSPVPHTSGANVVSTSTNAATMVNAVGHHNQQQQHHHHHQQQQQQQQPQQNHANTPTNTNIPAIIFSDYSSREIFDSLDLDLGQMDETALDLLSDQNSIMIADPTIEDSFRKDLN